MTATALIVEDHPEQAEMVSKMLRLRDYEPVVAPDGSTGLELARTLAPAVVLLDLMLPDINGFDVCRQLRTDRGTMLTPIVMVSALSGDEHQLRGFRVGANAYVTKPYGFDQLMTAITTARAWRSDMIREDLFGEIQVELDSEVKLLNDLNDFLLHLCRSTPFTNDQVMQLRQAVMEMAHNAIEWGNQHRSDRLVTIRYRIYPDRLEIVVRDQGKGFEREKLPHAASPGDPFTHLDVRDKLGLRAGGFGLMICKGMVDELRHNDVGNEVTLVKRYEVAAVGTGPEPTACGG